MYKKIGFTLAEALVTIMLIGVVATITLPFLYDSIRNVRLTTAFKNIYAETLSAVTNVAINDDCGNSLICTRLLKGTAAESTEAFGDEFVKAGMSASKICGMDDNGCFSYEIRNGLSSRTKGTIKSILNTNGISFDNPYTFVSTRGTSFAIYSLGLSCFADTDTASAAAITTLKSQYTFSSADEDPYRNPMNNICGIIVMDVNGQASPNQWGRDVFGLWITDNLKLDLVPFGNKNDLKLKDNSCNENNSLGCAATIMNAGWEMKY